jgi:hypothetical protein
VGKCPFFPRSSDQQVLSSGLLFLLKRKWLKMFMGMGKMMVELCSAAMLFKVCRYRSCNEKAKQALKNARAVRKACLCTSYV